jgi:2-polyprenyl-3-methyl-5-hydroxy-6-metoxy-1,4-benzoquinol methylase
MPPVVTFMARALHGAHSRIASHDAFLRQPAVSKVALMSDAHKFAEAWRRLMAPRSGDVREELLLEAAEFLGLSLQQAHQKLHGAGQRFREEWIQASNDPRRAADVTAFYNQTDTELFELIEWHATDPIHYRTLIVRDFALANPGREYLDYGSGIGSDALVFGSAGYTVTLADISDLLLSFAAFRCRRRGIQTRTIDLKHDELPDNAFDVVLCLDVLEHIPSPLNVVRSIHRAMRRNGLLVVHAPFGEDPDHPMHVVHRDVLTPRIRSFGLQAVDCVFPPEIRAPHLYQKQAMTAVDRLGYYVYDGYLHHAAIGTALAACYRFMRKGIPTFRRALSTQRSEDGA